MATLKLKPNSRKTPAIVHVKPTENQWEFNDVGVLTHHSGFSIQFFNDEECEIVNIPKDMELSEVRELTSKAIRVRNRRYR